MQEVKLQQAVKRKQRRSEGKEISVPPEVREAWGPVSASSMTRQTPINSVNVHQPFGEFPIEVTGQRSPGLSGRESRLRLKKHMVIKPKPKAATKPVAMTG